MKLSTRFAWMSAATLPVLVIAAGAALVPWETTDLRTERDSHLHARAELLVPQADRPLADPVAQVRQVLQAPDDVVVLAAHGTNVEVGDAPPVSDLPGTDGGFSARAGASALAGLLRLGRGLRRARLGPGTGDGPHREGPSTAWPRLVHSAVRRPGRLRRRPAARPPDHQTPDCPARAHGRVGAGTGVRLGLRTQVEEVDEVAAVLDAALARRDEQEARTVEAWQAARSFAATAAHELRTPLTGIQAALDVLDHPGAGEQDRREALADLRESHARVLGLLDVLRALSRVELTRPDAFAPVDLAELAETALHAARHRHPGVRFEAGGAVSGEVPGAATLVGWADGLRMILDNLLDNAAVHGGADGRGGGVLLGLWRMPGHLGVTVDDNGPGVPPELRPRVFERFGKSAGSRGFGLGLTIVAQVVALHQGTVEVADAPNGRGARFVVRLPVPNMSSVPNPLNMSNLPNPPNPPDGPHLPNVPTAPAPSQGFPKEPA